MNDNNNNPVRVAPKVLCDVCGFMVVAEGHEQRCRVREAPKKRDYELEKNAWFGDAKLLLDVRKAAVMEVPEFELCDAFVQRYTNNMALAAYMCNGPVVSKAEAKRLGTQFEECYYLNWNFRLNYLMRMFPSCADKIVLE